MYACINTYMMYVIKDVNIVHRGVRGNERLFVCQE